MTKARSIVLDSWAVMAYFQDEPTGEKVADIIADAQESGTPLLMSVVNLGEVWYTIARRRSPRDADKALSWLREIGIEFIETDWTTTRIAAGFKVKGGISF